MPFHKPKIEKHVYSIGEVAEMFEVKPSLIRYWEKVFPSLQLQKTPAQNRRFTWDDIEHLRLIYHLVKEQGLTLKGAQKKLKENRSDTRNAFEVIKHLQEIRRELQEIRRELEE